jgi:hypothetical protein
MSRQELKDLWFSLPLRVPKVPRKVIIVEKHNDSFWSVERITDVESHYATSNSNFNNAKEAMNRAMVMVNDKYYSEYELIIK